MIKNEKYFCMEEDMAPYWTGLSTFIAVIFGILFFFLALGTLADISRVMLTSKKEDDSYGMKLLLSFSIYTNFKAVMSTKESSRDTLTCLHGMRFISMTWVLLGHNFLFLNGALTIRNPLTLSSWLAGDLGLAFEAVWNALPSVDSFFLFRKDIQQS